MAPLALQGTDGRAPKATASYQPRAAPEEGMQGQSPSTESAIQLLADRSGPWPGAQLRLACLRGLKIGKRTGDAFNVGNVFEEFGNRVPFAAHEGLSRVVG